MSAIGGGRIWTRRWALLLVPGLLQLAACTGAAPGGDDAPSDGDAAVFGDTVTLSAQMVAGPGGTLIYEGEEYTGEIVVPGNALLGAMKDGQAYLYHPALGDEGLSKYNSQRAVGFFIYGLQQEAAGVPAKVWMARKEPLAVNATVRLATGVDITHVEAWEPTCRMGNVSARWVAVKTGRVNPLTGGYSIEYLAPKSFSPLVEVLSGITDWVNGEVNNTTEREARVEGGKVETFGAVVRAVPLALVTGPVGTRAALSGVGNAFEADPGTFLWVNAVDLTHFVFEGAKSISAVVLPVECADLMVSHAVGNLLETGVLLGMTADPAAVNDAVITGAIVDMCYSAGGCFGEVVTAPTIIGPTALLALNELYDIVGAGKWVFDTWLHGGFDVMRYAAYDYVELEETDPEQPDEPEIGSIEWCSRTDALRLEYNEVEKDEDGNCKHTGTIYFDDHNTEQINMLTLKRSKNTNGEIREYWYDGCVGVNCDGGTVVGRGFFHRFSIHLNGDISWEQVPEVGAVRMSEHCEWILSDPHGNGMPTISIENGCY